LNEGGFRVNTAESIDPDLSDDDLKEFRRLERMVEADPDLAPADTADFEIPVEFNEDGSPSRVVVQNSSLTGIIDQSTFREVAALVRESSAGFEVPTDPGA